MFHNHWDLEVFARDMQDRRRREADDARRLVLLKPRSHTGWRYRLAASVVGMAAAVRGLFARPEPAPTYETRPERASVAARQEGSRRPALRPHPQTDPFAAMAVVARPALLEVAERPCGVADC